MAEAEDADQLLRLAGFALAHAAWSIEDGETLCTLALIERETERELVRYEAPSIAGSVDAAHEHLVRALSGGDRAVLIYDGYVTRDDGERHDALVAELATSGPTAAGVIVQAYEPGRRGRFPLRRGQRVQLLGRPEVRGDFPDDAAETVVAGAREHERAAHLFGDT